MFEEQEINGRQKLTLEKGVSTTKMTTGNEQETTQPIISIPYLT